MQKLLNLFFYHYLIFLQYVDLVCECLDRVRQCLVLFTNILHRYVLSLCLGRGNVLNFKECVALKACCYLHVNCVVARVLALARVGNVACCAVVGKGVVELKYQVLT